MIRNIGAGSQGEEALQDPQASGVRASEARGSKEGASAKPRCSPANRIQMWGNNSLT